MFRLYVAKENIHAEMVTSSIYSLLGQLNRI